MHANPLSEEGTGKLSRKPMLIRLLMMIELELAQVRS